MLPSLYIQNEIEIKSSVEECWKYLVDPQKTPLYMFGCAALSDWKVGDTLDWEGEYEGTKMIFVKGIVEAIEPPFHLQYSVIDPLNQEIPDIPDNYLHVSYLISDLKNGSCLFQVRQGDYSGVAEGEKRYQEGLNGGLGWMPILEKIKECVEKQL